MFEPEAEHVTRTGPRPPRLRKNFQKSKNYFHFEHESLLNVKKLLKIKVSVCTDSVLNHVFFTFLHLQDLQGILIESGNQLDFHIRTGTGSLRNQSPIVVRLSDYYILR